MDIPYSIVKVYVTERNDVIKRHSNVITIWRTSAISETELLKESLLSEMKGVQEKDSITGVRGRQKNPSLAITVWHHSASLVMPDALIIGKDSSIHCAFDIFQKVVFCLTLYTEEVNLQIFVMI